MNGESAFEASAAQEFGQVRSGGGQPQGDVEESGASLSAYEDGERGCLAVRHGGDVDDELVSAVAEGLE